MKTTQEIAGQYSIDYQVAYNAHSGTSFSPEKRAKSEQDEFNRCLPEYLEKIWNAASIDEQKTVAIDLCETFARKYHGLYVAHLSCRSGLMSTMITGGSNFPVARMDKKNRSIHNKLEDLIYFTTEKLAKYVRIVNAIKPEGWSELVETRKQLEKAEGLQAEMKRINKELRSILKLPIDQQIEACKDKGIDPKVLIPDVMGTIGFASYTLTNRNSKIKRLQEKVANLERHEVELAQAEESGNDEQENEFFKIVDNVEADRVQLIFDGKPSDGIRSWLKSHGFRWSPRFTAWQRKRTNNAGYAVKQLIELMSNKELV